MTGERRAMITTSTGRFVDLFAMREEDVDVLDIAHSLSQINRFNGHVSHPVSVAQHSVYVSLLSPPGSELQGLLHDASEAYLGDVTHWLKMHPSFNEYRRAEEALQVLIFRKFGCDTVLSDGVRYADKRMCAYEAYRGGMVLMNPAAGYDSPTIAEVSCMIHHGWEFISYAEAENLFIHRFTELSR